MTDMNRLVLGQLVRVGIVSSIDAEKLKARVLFEERDNLVSGWLQVYQRPEAIVKVCVADSHTREKRLKTWMPEIGDHVLCLYLPTFNAAGFILGRVM